MVYEPNRNISTLGLDKQVQSVRIDIVTEPYPGR